MRFAAALPALAAALLLFHIAAARAEDQKMTAGQIRDALTGNTVEGVWQNTHYRSYFREDGLNIYQPIDGEAENGRWRIDDVNDQFCSWSVRSGWGCYNLYRDGDSIIWAVPDSDERYLSWVLPGNAL